MLVEALGLDPGTREALIKARFTTADQLVCASLHDIAAETTLSYDQAVIAQHAASVACYLHKINSAADLLAAGTSVLYNLPPVSVGCKVLDSGLHGGILGQGITELTGESGSGKTQICLQTCIGVATPTLAGGLGKDVLYICTEDSFPVQRLHQLICRRLPQLGHSFSLETVADRILIEHVASAEGLVDLLTKKVPVLVRQRHVKLIVIDSITALFRGEPDFRHAADRARAIGRIASLLKGIHTQSCVFLLCVNQVSALIPDNGSRCNNVVPALGLFWSNLVTTRLMLHRTGVDLRRWVSVSHIDPPKEAMRMQRDAAWNPSLRQLKVVFSPHLPQRSCWFLISEDGVHGLCWDHVGGG